MTGSTAVPALTGTQAAILGAYTELIEEVGSDDVSYRVIARRAGIAERTVFRNYPTRVDLLLATTAWIESTLFAREELHSIFDVPLAIRDAMQRYDARPELAHVVAETAMRGMSGALPSPGRAQLERLLDAEVPSLDAAQRRAIIAALSHLNSVGTWVTLRREFGMDRRDIADAAAWAAEAVLDGIRDRVASRPGA